MFDLITNDKMNSLDDKLNALFLAIHKLIIDNNGDFNHIFTCIGDLRQHQGQMMDNLHTIQTRLNNLEYMLSRSNSQSLTSIKASNNRKAKTFDPNALNALIGKRIRKNNTIAE